MSAVLIVGMAVVDFVFALESLPKCASKYRADRGEIVGGGCAANAAVAIARLGGRARLAARLGADPIGDLILADLEAEGVDTTLVERKSGGASSFSSVYVDASGERQIVNFRGANLTDDPSCLNMASKPDAVLVDTRWPAGAIRALETARTCGVPGIVDAEPPMDEAVLRLASHVAFSRDGLFQFAGMDDLAAALQVAASRLTGWISVTDGENGVYILNAGGMQRIPAFAVAVKDTLAAGDVWHGAFALALAEGEGEIKAVRFANAAAALKCTEFGGRKGCPDRKAVEQYLLENL